MSLVQSRSSRVDKRSASTVPAQKGGCAALIHPTLFAENKFILGPHRNPATLPFSSSPSRAPAYRHISDRLRPLLFEWPVPFLPHHHPAATHLHSADFY